MGIETDEFPPLPNFNQRVFKLEQNKLLSMLKSVSLPNLQMKIDIY